MIPGLTQILFTQNLKHWWILILLEAILVEQVVQARVKKQFVWLPGVIVIKVTNVFLCWH